MDYATLEELLGYLPSVTSDEDKGVLAAMITRGSRAIDTYTRRDPETFAPAPTEASARRFYGADSAVLLLSEFVADSIEEVTAPTGYMPEDYVEFRRGQIRGLHTATTDKILTPRVVWKKGVPFTVTARWGYAAIPADIKEALMQLVVRWWRSKDEAFAGVIGQVGTDRTIIEKGFPSGVKTLLGPYVLESAEEDEEAGTIERSDLLDADSNPERWGRW